jgi:branched-chain amino acid transport system permease protein
MELLDRIRPTGSADEGAPPMRKRRRMRAPIDLPMLLLLVGYFLFLLIGSIVSSDFGQQTVSGLSAGATYGALGLALVLIYRATEVLNLAQGEMAMFSTFIAFQFNVKWGWNYWAAFVITLLISFAGGILIQRVIIRPVENANVLTIVIVTVGLFLLFGGLALRIWGGVPQTFRGPLGADATSHVKIGDIVVAKQDLVTIGVSLAAVFLLWLLFQYTKVGLAMRAAALRPAAARLVGVRVSWMYALGWGLAAVLGAVAGLMIVPTLGLDPTFMEAVLLYAFSAAVLGGLESPIGAVVGGLILGSMLNLLAAYVDWIGNVLRLPVALAVLLVVLLVRPAGLFGHETVEKV